MSVDARQTERSTPRKIHADRPARELQIEWADGHRSAYDFTGLRWLCPCAFCRGEAGQPGWLDSNPTLGDDQVTLTDVAMVGHYAIQPFWADGHSTGFYSFAHLRRECSCPEDRARRSSGPGDSITQRAPKSSHTESNHTHGDPAHVHGDPAHAHGDPAHVHGDPAHALGEPDHRHD